MNKKLLLLFSFALLFLGACAKKDYQKVLMDHTWNVSIDTEKNAANGVMRFSKHKVHLAMVGQKFSQKNFSFYSSEDELVYDYQVKGNILVWTQKSSKEKYTFKILKKGSNYRLREIKRRNFNSKYELLTLYEAQTTAFSDFKNKQKLSKKESWSFFERSTDIFCKQIQQSVEGHTQPELLQEQRQKNEQDLEQLKREVQETKDSKFKMDIINYIESITRYFKLLDEHPDNRSRPIVVHFELGLIADIYFDGKNPKSFLKLSKLLPKDYWQQSDSKDTDSSLKSDLEVSDDDETML